MIATMTEAIKPAPWPALYQPMNCPMIPARNEPAIPSRIVMIKPMFSLPGCDQFGDEANDKTQHDSPDDAHVLTSLRLECGTNTLADAEDFRSP